jgi:KaiC/GvpD/RAD55 family RecA-like ATPase
VTGSLATVADELPGALYAVARVVVDNPLDTAITLSGALVLGQVMHNLVRPRTLPQLAATMLVANTLGGWGLAKAIEHGVISFRLREPDGSYTQLRDLITGERELPDADSADPAG